MVPLDGSAGAEQAIPVAIRVARATSASVVLLEVIPPPIVYGAYTPEQVIQESFEAAFAEADKYLKQMAQSNAGAGVSIYTEVLAGPVAPAILDSARSHPFDLVIINSHGYTGLTRLMLGSVAEEVAFSSPRPVLVLRDGETLPADTPANASRPMHTLVTLDGSTLAEAVLIPAIELSIALAPSATCELHLLRVINLPADKDKNEGERAKEVAKAYLNDVIFRLRDEEWRDLKFTVTSSAIVATDTAAGIINVVEKGEERQDAGAPSGYDLIAMATHGRGELQRLIIRSVTERILKATKLPILIVRAPMR